jgi:tetratricopeptide (TPR) repeat protein
VNERLTDENVTRSAFLDCAVEIARAIETLEGRSEVISLVASKYAESGQLDAAVDLAETIDDSYLRDQALGGIAARCIELGDSDYAEELSETIEDETAYALATEQMAVAHAESGALEKAIEVAHRLADSAPTLSRIALACVTGGHPVQALEVARSIDYPDLKVPVLVELAAKALHDGRNPEALELILEATEMAEEIEFSEQRTSAFVAIASLNKECGEVDQALAALSRARDLCLESKDLNKDADLAQLAGGFAELQRYDEADQVLEEIENPFQFAHATAKVALEYHRAGDSDRALTLLAQAGEIVRGEDVYGEQSLIMREGLLDFLAGCYAIVGRFEDALQMVGLMNSLEQQQRTLCGIAKYCVSTGNHNRAFEVTERIKDNYARVTCEVEVVDAFIASDQLALADHTLSQALTRTLSIERAYQKAMSLMEIALRLARREQPAKASETLFESLTTLALIDGRYLQSQALINLAGKYQELGLPAGEKEQAVLEEITRKLD